MGSGTFVPNLIDKTKTALTATAFATALVLTGETILPSRYYELESPFCFGYQWEVRGIYGVAVEPKVVFEEFEIIQHFVSVIASRSTDLDPRYDRIISNNFWKLV